MKFKKQYQEMRLKVGFATRIRSSYHNSPIKLHLVTIGALLLNSGVAEGGALLAAVSPVVAALKLPVRERGV